MQYVPIILAIVCFSILKKINENSSTRKPENGCHGIAIFRAHSPRSVHSFDFSFVSHVMYPCFIHSYDSTQISAIFFLWSNAKYSTETSSRRRFFPFDTDLAHSFLTSKVSTSSRCTALLETPTSRTFSRRPCNSIYWAFVNISGATTSFGLPLRFSSWQLVRPCLIPRHPILYTKEQIRPEWEFSSTLTFQIMLLYQITVNSSFCVYKFSNSLLLMAAKQTLNTLASSNLNFMSLVL